ncbi:kinesin-like protein KIF26A isoform X1 [Mytilus edulis]|uniref:kinesin-like protein KIF26A isoform X1 n=2 Tax=Mytilus edulis TaxID=6550 RepID=UPI0039EEF508
MKPSARPKASGIPCLKLQQGGSVPDHSLRGNVVRNNGRTIVRPGEVNNRFKSQFGEQSNSFKPQTGEWNSRFRVGVVDHDSRFRNQIREQDSRFRKQTGIQENRIRNQIGEQDSRLRNQQGDQGNRLKTQIGDQGNRLRTQIGEQENRLRNNTGEQNNRFRTQILKQDNNFKNQVVEQNQIEKEQTQVCDGERTAKIEKQSKGTEDVEKEKVPGKDCIGTEHGRSLHNDNAATGEQSTEMVPSDDKVSCNQTEKTSNIIQKEENYTASISIEPAVYKFGSEAKIRKLPTPLKNKSPDIPAKNELSQNAIGKRVMMDYPIRGTISPLSDQAINQKSFVFGRPSSPVNHSDIQRCKSPPDQSRPLSPLSESLSNRRPVYGKPPKYVPPSSRSAKSGAYARTGGICDQCNNCLLDLKRQAVRLMNVEKPSANKVLDVDKIGEKLQISDNKAQSNGHCTTCDTNLQHLKQEALAMVQCIQQAQSEGPKSGIRPPNTYARYTRSKSQPLPANGQPIHPNQAWKTVQNNNHIYEEPNMNVDQQHSGLNYGQVDMLNNYSVSGVPTYMRNQYYSQPPNLPPPNPGMSTNIPHYNQQNFNPAMGTPSNIPPYNQQNYSQATGSSSNVPQYNQQNFNQQMGSLSKNPQFNQHNFNQQMGSPSNIPQYNQPNFNQQMGSPSHMPQHNQPNYNQVMGSPQYGQHQQIGSPNMPQFNQQLGSPQNLPAFNQRIGSPPPGSYQRMMSPPPGYSSRMSSPPPSAAASFFARAAQKLGKKKRRHQATQPDTPSFPTKFYEVVRTNPPPIPPCLLRTVGRVQNPGVGKVKVMLKICPSTHHSDQGTSFLSIDPRRKQITVFDPTASGIPTSAHRKTSAPKMFAFDAVFSPDDSQSELCSSSLTEIIQGVVSGADGCVFTYGHSKIGKSYTIVGSDKSAQTLGIIPSAITWLFRLINEQKDKTGARFSVRVSAVEVTGKQELLRDLLSEVAQGTESGQGTSPGVYLREDPICGTQLENQSELRAPTAERACYYLDAALASRTALDDDGQSSHMLFTIHVYQYRIEKANQAGLPGVAGGRSRLHLIDLGSPSRGKDPNDTCLNLPALGNVIMALLNGQRHVPNRDSKVAQLLKDSLGNISCRACMIAHVSSSVHNYNETLQVIQLGARIHRMRRRKTRFSGTSSDDSSTDESRLRRPLRGFRMGTLREDMVYSSSLSDPDYTSSSEQSCDTAIYLGPNGLSLSDREVTDNEGPPRSVPRTNPRLPRRPSGSRSSGDEGSASDSGRSNITELRYYHNMNKLPMRSSESPEVLSPPLSPTLGLVHVPKKSNIRTRLSSSKEDKNRQVNPPKDIKGEQWIDGPGANVKKRPEQWIDGPEAVFKKQDKQEPKKHLFNPKMNAEEQWVDGPREMCTGSHASKSGKSDPKHSKAKSKLERPDSTASAESSSSLTPQVSNSRPTSINDSDNNVKPFVRDWVENLQIEAEIEATAEAKYRRPKPENKKKMSVSTPKHSPRHSPKNSPSLKRKEVVAQNTLTKSQLPAPTSTTKRVTEWLRSVSLEQEEKSEETKCKPAEPEVQSSADAGCPDEMANIADISFDSSADTGEFSTVIQHNRDSIYEIQVDEQLEHNCGTNDVADDDTFSNLSCSHDNEEETECDKTGLESVQEEMMKSDHTCYECNKNQNFDYESIYKLAQPLSRKPDGASNPNLSSDFELYGKTPPSEYVINNVQFVSSQEQNSTSDVLKDLSLKYTLERDTSISKTSSKSKPPLPQKSLSRSSSAASSPAQSRDACKSNKTSTSSIPLSCTSKTKERVRQLSSDSSSVPVSSSSPSSVSSASSPSTSRLPILSNSKTKSKTKKGEKGKLHNVRINELNVSRGTDSDSGNDSGIVSYERSLLSPYSTVTKPRTPSHSSSGHGSDNSSNVSAELRSHLKLDKIHGGTSSGYESMLRDSEVSASSSTHEDSNSESSEDKKKQKKGSRRSRSAPARSDSEGKKSPSSKAWVDTRQIQKIKEEPFEIKSYNMDDVERLGRRRQDELQDSEVKPKDLICKHEDRNQSYFDCKFLMCFCRNKPKQTEV